MYNSCHSLRPNLTIFDLQNIGFSAFVNVTFRSWMPESQKVFPWTLSFFRQTFHASYRHQDLFGLSLQSIDCSPIHRYYNSRIHKEINNAVAVISTSSNFYIAGAASVIKANSIAEPLDFRGFMGGSWPESPSNGPWIIRC